MPELLGENRVGWSNGTRALVAVLSLPYQLNAASFKNANYFPSTCTIVASSNK